MVLNSRHASGGSELPQYSVQLEDGEEQHNFLAATAIKYRLPEAADTKPSPQKVPVQALLHAVVVRNGLQRQVSSETLGTQSSSNKAASTEKSTPTVHITGDHKIQKLAWYLKGKLLIPRRKMHLITNPAKLW